MGPKNTIKANNTTTKWHSGFEAPCNWIKEVSELATNCKNLLLMENWLLRHCSDAKCNKTMRLQPLKLFIHGCLQAFIDCQADLFGAAQNRINWLRQLFISSSSKLARKKIDTEGINYMLDCMEWFISTCPGQQRKDGAISLDFKKLSKSAQTTVRSSKLVFYGTAHFPLKIQRRLAFALVGEEEGCKNFELMHHYVRILIKCRHQKHNETLGLAGVLPTEQEIFGINEALNLDPTNYKIKITMCELLYDFVNFKTTACWKPFRIGEQKLCTPGEIVRFLDTQIRELLELNSHSVRLNNLAAKLGISKTYREVFQDEKSRKFFLNKINISFRINPTSASANYLIGLRDIYYGNFDGAIKTLRQAMLSKPLSPKYTLAYIRALVASCSVNKKSQTVREIKKLIQEKIVFGSKYKWSDWNIHHLQFMSGVLTWITTNLCQAFKEFRSYYSDGLPIFQEQFRYLSPIGLKILMLPTQQSVVQWSTLLEFCHERKKSKPILPLEIEFIKSLYPVRSRATPHKDFIIYNKFYLKDFRPFNEMIKIEENAEIALPTFDWIKLQEKKVIVEIDQEKLIRNRTWYMEKILQLFESTMQIENQAVPIKKETKTKKKKIKSDTWSEGDEVKFHAISSKFTKTKSRMLFLRDTPVC